MKLRGAVKPSTTGLANFHTFLRFIFPRFFVFDQKIIKPHFKNVFSQDFQVQEDVKNSFKIILSFF